MMTRSTRASASRARGRRRQGVVGLELDHRPDDDAKRPPARPRAAGTGREARDRPPRWSCSRATADCGTTRSRGRWPRRCVSSRSRACRAPKPARRARLRLHARRRPSPTASRSSGGTARRCRRRDERPAQSSFVSRGWRPGAAPGAAHVSQSHCMVRGSGPAFHSRAAHPARTPHDCASPHFLIQRHPLSGIALAVLLADKRRRRAAGQETPGFAAEAVAASTKV